MPNLRQLSADIRIIRNHICEELELLFDVVMLLAEHLSCLVDSIAD